jgi:hypothetical protein
VAFSPQANYTGRATAACRRSQCKLLRIAGVAWSAQRIPTTVNLGFLDRKVKYPKNIYLGERLETGEEIWNHSWKLEGKPQSLKWEHEMSPVKEQIKIWDNTGKSYSPALGGTDPWALSGKGWDDKYCGLQLQAKAVDSR